MNRKAEALWWGLHARVPPLGLLQSPSAGQGASNLTFSKLYDVHNPFG